MSNDGLIIENMDLSHIHLAVALIYVSNLFSTFLKTTKQFHIMNPYAWFYPYHEKTFKKMAIPLMTENRAAPAGLVFYKIF